MRSLKRAVWEEYAPQQCQLCPTVEQRSDTEKHASSRDERYLTAGEFHKFALGSIECIEFRSDDGKPGRPKITLLDNTKGRRIDPGFDEKWGQ